MFFLVFLISVLLRFLVQLTIAFCLCFPAQLLPSCLHFDLNFSSSPEGCTKQSRDLHSPHLALSHVCSRCFLLHSNRPQMGSARLSMDMHFQESLRSGLTLSCEFSLLDRWNSPPPIISLARFFFLLFFCSFAFAFSFSFFFFPF